MIRRTVFVLFAVGVLLSLSFSKLNAQQDFTLTIFLDQDTLTVYISGNQTVSLADFLFEVSIKGTRYTYRLDEYPHFEGLDFTKIDTPTCFHLKRYGSPGLLPSKCWNDVPTSNLFIQPLPNYNVFWHDKSTGNSPRIFLMEREISIGQCSVALGRCEVTYPTITPTPSDWSPITQVINGMPMVYVPKGCFMMGSEDGDDDEKSVHKVCLSAFWLGQTEVTNEQYSKCVDEGECSPPANQIHFQDPDYADHPVINVSWFEANEYARWLGGALPTEAQWEYAAREPAGYTYPWGSEMPTCKLANFLGCGESGTKSIRNYPEGKSWVGAFDMSGNVSEWTFDWYKEDYYNTLSGNELDPAGPSTGEKKSERGGSFISDVNNIRASHRSGRDPGDRFPYLGFRVVVPVTTE